MANGTAIGYGLARGMKSLGQTLMAKGVEKRRRTEQEQKAEAKRREQEEKEEQKRLAGIEEEADKALDEMVFLESIGDQPAMEALYNYNIQRMQSGLPAAPLGSQRLKVIKERGEALAEEDQARQEEEELAQGFQAFGQPMEKLGVHVPESIEQQPLDFSGMFSQTLGITPASMATPTGKQETAQTIQEVINQITALPPEAYDEPSELQAIGQTALEAMRERELIEATFAGRKRKVQRRAAGIGVSRADFTEKELKSRYASYKVKSETFNRSAAQKNKKAAIMAKDFPALAQAKMVEPIEIKPFDKWKNQFLSQFETSTLRALQKQLEAGEITQEDLTPDELDALIEYISGQK